MNQLPRIIPGRSGGRPTILPTKNQEKIEKDRHAAVIAHLREKIEQVRRLKEKYPALPHNFPNPYARKRSRAENNAQLENLMTFEPYPQAKKRRMDAEATPPPSPPKKTKPAPKGVAQVIEKLGPADGEPRRVMSTPERARRRREKITEARSRLAMRAAEAEEEARIHQEMFMHGGILIDEEAESSFQEEVGRRQGAARRRRGGLREMRRDDLG